MSKSNVDAAMALFGDVPTVEAPAKKTGSKTKDRQSVDYGEDLDFVAALKLVAKDLSDTADVLDADLKLRIQRDFAEMMIEKRMRPDSFIAKGPRCSGMASLGKKSISSPLDAETITYLESKKIPYQTLEKMPSRLIINPEILNDQETLAAVAEALRTHPKLKDVHVIKRQEGVETHVTSDDTLPAFARAVKDVEEALKMMPKLSSISLGKFAIDELADSSKLLSTAVEIILPLVSGDALTKLVAGKGGKKSSSKKKEAA